MDRLRQMLSKPGTDFVRLSSRSALSEERLSQLAGGADPTMAEVRALASALNMAIEDFAAPTQIESMTEMLFRSAAVVGGQVDDDARASLSRRVADPLSFVMAQPNLNALWHSQFVRAAGHEEQNAATFRRIFCGNDQLSPLIRLPKIVEDRMGILVLVVRTNAVDGASGYIEGVPFALIAARSFTPRMLFTLAHELGHIILHHDPQTGGAIIDQVADWHHFGGGSDPREKEANEFASALLMPAPAVGIAVKTAREVLSIADEELGDLEINFIARLFGVSFAAAAIRCERLGLLPNGGAAALASAVKDEAGTAEIRGHSVGLPARAPIEFSYVPQALLRAAVKSVGAGDVSIGRAASALQISISELMAANVSGHA